MLARSYHCPGDAHPISRSVHLARLAADYCKCTACPHKNDLGGIGLPPRLPRVEAPLLPALERERIFRSLRNPGAQREVLDHCETLAALFWRETPWELPLNDWDAAEARVPTGPAVCIAWSENETARSFASEVIRIISRSGCRVTTLGSLSRPALDFAVDHLDCIAGVWVEGGGSPAGIGFRVVGSASMSWSADGRLDDVVKANLSGTRRPSRSAGSVRSFDILPAYRESLARHFAASPITEVAAAGMAESVQNAWAGLQERVGCQLRIAAAATRSEETPSALVLRNLQEEVVRNRLGGGIVFGPDGRQAWVIDRREGLLSDLIVAERIVAELRRETGDREVRVVATEDLMWTGLNVSGARLLACAPGEQQLVEAMQRHRASLGCDGAGRYWIARPTPRCDALLTLAYVSRALDEMNSALSKAAA